MTLSGVLFLLAFTNRILLFPLACLWSGIATYALLGEPVALASTIAGPTLGLVLVMSASFLIWLNKRDGRVAKRMQAGPRGVPWSIQLILIGLLSNAAGIPLLLGGGGSAALWVIALGAWISIVEVPILLFSLRTEKSEAAGDSAPMP